MNFFGLMLVVHQVLATIWWLYNEAYVFALTSNTTALIACSILLVIDNRRYRFALDSSIELIDEMQDELKKRVNG
jgi:hypothetical protein